MSEYDAVQKGALKLKGKSSLSIKKKKKKKSKQDKEKATKMLEQIQFSEPSTSSGERSKPALEVEKKTKAELAFFSAKNKRAADELLIKASTTHKERIMDFNERLDRLTEHYDIPKVSWTK